MQHLSLQDILTMMGTIVSPILALLGFMWHHFNGQFKEIKGEMKEEINGVKSEINGVKTEINEVKSEINRVKGEINEVKSEINGVKGEINGVRSEINGVRVEMKEMEIRLTNKIDTSYKSLNEQISMDRERISRIEGYLTLPSTIPPQAEITEKKKYRPPVKVANA
jgi:chromosome segregation ATPase